MKIFRSVVNFIKMHRKERRVKFSVTMPEQKANRLTEIAEEAGVEKRVVVNAALTLFEAAVHEVQAGRQFGSVDEKNRTFKEAPIPLLAAFAKTSHPE